MGQFGFKTRSSFLTFRSFENGKDFSKELASNIAQIIKNAIREQGEAVIALSGGQTPQKAYVFLSQFDIDWSRVRITLVSERWVPHNHPRSNHTLLDTTLFYSNLGSSNFIPLYRSQSNLMENIEELNSDIQKLRKPFDLVLLGLGYDGHTANLFPDGDNLVTALDINLPNWFVDMQKPDLPEPRITMTLKTLLESRRVFLAFSGQDKMETFLKAREEGPVEHMPIRAILRNQHIPVDVFYSDL